ncbi:alpha-hydroxy acid oxidase [Stella sp.]|uniref:alpha-hydroxy acid oxidase n=1 Tax=Stella sp. TaxID=2912054 RepID=UPI0035B35791
MNLERAVNLDDLRRMAKRRLPRICYDFIEGGVDGEDGLDRAVDAFRNYRIVPRFMVDVTQRSQKTTLFGREYASPFGIAPTGLAGLFRPGADMMLAEAARDADIPFIMSGSATGSIEDLARVAPEHGWYQLYPAKTWSISEGMVARARDAGLSTLVLTVDVPCPSNRERNIRNGFARPLRMSLRTRLEALLHPGWMMEYLRTGTPMFDNWAPYAKPGATADEVADFVVAESYPPLTWSDVEKLRRLWPRNLVLKGIMHPDDAIRAADLGVDGIMVSNHGARQLDRSPAPLDVLPAVVEAVGERMTVMLDGGVRRGSDALIAQCLGAKLVFMGRATLYGAAAAGKPGVDKALAIMRREVDLAMAQMGCPAIDRLGPDFLMWEKPEDRLRNRRI